MSRKRGPDGPHESPEELWQAVARTVRPLTRREEAPPIRLHRTPSAPSPPRVVLPAHPSPPARAHAAPADRSPEKRVRRGRLAIDARLDLHGMTQAEAQAAIGRFLAHHRGEGARCVVVVTGKGRGEGGGVLRRALPGWLARERVHVSGYAEAHRKDGGGGAWYVFLRAR